MKRMIGLVRISSGLATSASLVGCLCINLAWASSGQSQIVGSDTSIAADPARCGETGVAPVRIESVSLPNLIQVTTRVLSGGLPEGEAGFNELSQLGVRTIISVDGATPDVALAKRFGMRYVHLPHGYDGISATRSWELAKAVRELEGPLYIHCHHGKHRSPAAAELADSLHRQSDPVALSESAGELLKRITVNCSECHAAYRDSPAD